MKRTKKSGMILIAMMVVLATIGGVFAYFTDKDTAVNTFTVGKIALELTEPNWDPEEAASITPMKQIAKDPKVTNTGVNPEFIFLEVLVPYENLITADTSGQKKEAADTQLYTYEINEGWTLLGDGEKDTDLKVMRYLYVYGTDTSCMVLEPEAVTPTLFDQVTFANVVESDSFQGIESNLIVNAYGIQTTDVSGGVTDPETVWSALAAQVVTE